jgi:(p)ppGpp synthase/HD superfamily hydrolase
VTAHAGQSCKDGSPYILHPLRLMLKMSTDEERMVAVLHDVVEDTSITLEDLRREGFSAAVLEALRLLTHEKEVPYEEYVARIKPHPLAREVKLADLEDNSDIKRLKGIEEKDFARMKKYHRAWMILKE